MGLRYGISLAEGGLFTDAPVWSLIDPCASPLSPCSSKGPVRQSGKGDSICLSG
jgi:hypothetical protein